ncbi:hypothetical protein MHM84_20445 [Halomonas sp. McH1-25]|uniref:type IV toxin-antitoxin system AbiEi family antitoxin n=1 Tax=unclassified Halomonas TaxID=2609666 RepID=UPI001EF43CED|nr:MULTISPECIES: type IV toxin-antitoxin system AbiEi family antitoxin [unclassified Halomonas]MCG7602112.1 hypothetical protein [Halomonas sp. McH1-25]MCP1343030.1 type IV toxin-antitoxin system AbiEi family antitoxin [Halomonas sp. FL8]MCP1362983.1 type IV toxin-antitoxin system AbiEi family antitoxin [Halomonas sp. BBD45]MCP1364808.1 type IV toxin-antitoxin system AbiEi family antitoxin [Halomonas sp. BBD48]
MAEAAIAAFQAETGLSASLSPAMEGVPQHEFLAELSGHRFHGEVKRWVSHNVAALSYQWANAPDRLLIADYLNVNAARTLQSRGIQFIDIAGNAFIDQPQLKVLIRGNRRTTTMAAEERSHPVERAFQRKGLVVIYHLLTLPELAGAPIRTLAQCTGVSHGTVENVLKALVEGGLAATLRKANRRITKITEPRKLMERWVVGYGEKLASKLIIGEFYSEATDWWGEDSVTRLDAAWGGEIAGSYYSGHLKPQVATLYLSREKLPQLMQAHRLRKPPTGIEPNLRIMERFWLDERPESSMVHPLLAYAELLRSGDARNADIARRLDERYLADAFGGA